MLFAQQCARRFSVNGGGTLLCGFPQCTIPRRTLLMDVDLTDRVPVKTFIGLPHPLTPFLPKNLAVFRSSLNELAVES